MTAPAAPAPAAPAPGDTAAQAAALAARAAYGRLLAWLACQWRDVAAAEDALGDALVAALETWPRDGVPARPESWLLTAARRRLLRQARGRRRLADPALRLLLARGAAEPEPFALPDARLRLMLVCAHPAIDPRIRPALMLQAVLGVEAARLARVCLVSPDALAKRLVRAKAKIRAAGIRFETPDAADLPARIDAVLEAIYGAYALDGAQGEPEPAATELAGEALHLAALVAALLPGCAEALGLAALLACCEARRGARRDAAGAFVPLDEQDPARWDAGLLARAEAWLAAAARLGAPGPYQLEAAIQSAHCHRRHGGATPWPAIVALYESLLAMAPTVGARLGHAVARAEATGDAAAALTGLADLEGPAIAGHQPWWAVRAHLLARAGRRSEARDACERALALTADPVLARWLARRRDALSPR